MISIYITTGVSIFTIIMGLSLFIITLANNDCEKSFKITTCLLSVLIIVMGIVGIYSNINKASKINTVDYYNTKIIETENKLNELLEQKNILLKGDKL